MTTAEVGSKVAYIAEPTTGMEIWVIAYTKANDGDTLNVASITPIKTILQAYAISDADGVLDPVVISGSTMTFSTTTTDGKVIVFGKS